MPMKISLIVAMARNHIIGIDNRLPWKLPADLAWFKKNSMGKPLLMGRKTWESLPIRPLPGREHFIVTRNSKYQACKPDGTLVAPLPIDTTATQEQTQTGNNTHICESVQQAIAQAKHYCQSRPDVDELMIMGGASIYAETLERCDRMYLTIIDEDIPGDASFPQFEKSQWKETFRQNHQADEKNPHHYDFVILDRNE